MNRPPIAHRSILLSALAIVLFSTTGCFPIFYRTNSQPGISAARIDSLQTQDKYFILHYAGLSPAKLMVKLVVQGDSIHATLADLEHDHAQNLLPDPKNMKNRLGTKTTNRRDGLKEVHLYTDYRSVGDYFYSAPISSINRADIYEINQKATSNSRILNVVVLAVTAVLVYLSVADIDSGYY